MKAVKQATKYVSKPPNAQGLIAWESWEDKMWAKMTKMQDEKVQRLACDEYKKGQELLNFPRDRMPQLPDVNAVLQRETGWAVEPVPCLISFEKFFKLLSEKKFPCATFIRIPDELLYVQEPDIFHEIYGHTPLLTNPYFAEFNEYYGKLGLKATPEERSYLARLYWFTIEFGLVKKPQQDLQIYGGGILSSIGETDACLTNKNVEIRKLDFLTALRTPYRIDIMQPIYYYVEDFKELAELKDPKIMDTVREAMKLGMFEPTFPPKEELPSQAEQDKSLNQKINAQTI